MGTTMSFSLRQLQYFLAIAETGSVSRAAAQISTSQSTITEAMKDLEADLGVKLLERQSRGLGLTHKGQLFRRHAERIWQDVADARGALANVAPEVTGRLALGVTSLVAGYVLSDLLARFSRAFPGVSVDLVEDGHDYLEHLLLNGEIDLALVTMSGLHNPESLAADELEAYRYRLWVASGHTLAERDHLDLQMISEFPQIALSIDEIEEPVDHLWRGSGLRPHIAFRSRSVEAVRSLVAGGVGVAILPDLVFRPWSLDGLRLEARQISAAMPMVKAALVRRRGTHDNLNARRFIEVTLSHNAGRLMP
ncbi:DNA-binding transcriptional regulator, LysR family [Pleomorphomonas diazotrophica]|nr:DNA-binding transcriptional regulator, LysR family [Pleomorphomonas diazotrophica]